MRTVNVGFFLLKSKKMIKMIGLALVFWLGDQIIIALSVVEVILLVALDLPNF